MNYPTFTNPNDPRIEEFRKNGSGHAVDYSKKLPCPGMEISPGVWSGCDQSGGDCPTCGK